jgi:hypothetical protein
MFRERRGDEAETARQIKRWVAEVLDLPPQVLVMVAELSCSEPGCPPVETVISIQRAGAPPRVHKIHRPAAEIAQGDLLRALSENAVEPPAAPSDGENQAPRRSQTCRNRRSR